MKAMKAFTVKWHPERDVTTIEYAADFVDSHVVLQADILQDALVDLNDKYKEVMEKF